MSGHIYHGDLEGYDVGQLLVDGCPECEKRGQAPAEHIAHMTPVTFARAWRRAVRYEQEDDLKVSRAERPVLHILWVIALQFSRRGIALGEVPDGLYHSARNR